MRYIELNPVRAGMVGVPRAYRLSSYRANAAQAKDRIVMPHAAYLRLGATLDDRGYAYRELFRSALAAEQVHALRAAVEAGTPFGNARFRARVKQV